MKWIILPPILSCFIFYSSALKAQLPNGSIQPAATASPLPAAYTNTSINYVRTWEPSVPMTDPAAVAGNNNVRQVKQNSQYFDGLGRPLQTVSKGMGTGGKDIVAPVVYDAFGREQFKYLPYVSPGSDGKFKTNPFAEQSQFMSGYYPGESVYYGETEFEASPLNRVMKSYAPGNSWARTGGNRPAGTEYLVNTAADAVTIWDMPINGTLPSRVGAYPAGELYKNVVKDEHGKSIVEFKDKQDRVILKKVQLLDNAVDGHAGWLCTYYVYDDLNNLRIVLPPKAVESLISNNWTFAAGVAEELCFQYKYDGRRRMIEKRVPGVTAPTELVYDVRDRLVFSRDGNLAAAGKWMLTFYDGLNRPTMTAFYASTDARDALQTGMNAAVSNTTTVTYDFPVPGVLTASEHDGRPKYQASQSIDFTTGFDTNSMDTEGEIVPGGKSGTTILTVTNPLPTLDANKVDPLTYTFYDNYNYTGAHALRTADLSKPQSTDPAREVATAASIMTRGMVTGTKVRVLGTNQWLTATSYYDDKGRVIQAIVDNVSGNQDVISTLYAFSGQVLSTYQYHNNAKSVPTTTTRILTVLDYDDAGRLLTVRKQINDQPLKVLATNEYDAMGQLKTKTLGNNLETLNYNYNIRGWLKGINKNYITANETHFFGTELHYDYGYSANQYNGNIAGATWRSFGDGQRRSYGYSYDAANRLLKADFTEGSGSTWATGAKNFSMQMGDGINPTSAYDANGNIKAMSQQGLKGTSSGLIDQLTYEYLANSNKLKGVTDAVNDPTSTLGDFKEINGTGTNDYAYDSNGNLTQDGNKNIAAGGIIYNHLNLPSQITVAGKGTINYLYDAAGAKLRKTVTDNTSGTAKTTITDYIGGFVYQNDTLQFFGHEEGRVRWVAGGPVFDYFLKDHLGNTRMVLTEQTDFSMYAATMESANAAKENALFSNIEETRTAKPVGYPSGQDQNEFTAKLNAKSGGKKIGPSLVLKVMAGDTIQLSAQAFYKSQGPSNNKVATPVEDMVADLAAAFSTSTQESSIHGNAQQAGNSPFTSNFYSNDYQRLKERDQDPNQPDKPKAYLNFVLFDEQFNLVESGSGVKQVKAEPDQLQQLAVDKKVMNKSGYLYVYTSNESQQDVFFDNVMVGRAAGPILEETHYYPFGLTMAGISNKAIGPLENKYKYNGKELQNREFSDGSGLEWTDYGWRMYDNQIGRFFTQDRFSGKYYDLSPYQYTSNNPIRYMDARGDSIIDGDHIVKELKTHLTNSITGLNAMVKSGALPQGITADMVNGLVSEYQTTLNEIGALESSDQIYNVSYNNSQDEGGTSYNEQSGQIDIGVAKGSNFLQSVGLASHELKHGYQFEAGKVSFVIDGKSYGKLYDLSDEKAAYNRQAYLEHGVFYKDHLLDNKGVLTRGAGMTPPAYQGLPSGSIDINSKAGKALREQTINAGKASTPVTEVYKNWQADYKKGQQ